MFWKYNQKYKKIDELIKKYFICRHCITVCQNKYSWKINLIVFPVLDTCTVAIKSKWTKIFWIKEYMFLLYNIPPISEELQFGFYSEWKCWLVEINYLIWQQVTLYCK